MENDYPGPERRVVDRRTDIEDLVVRSAELAAKHVERAQRRRLVAQAFVAALLAATVIAVPVTIVLSVSSRHAAAENATFNCNQGKRYTAVFRRFIASDAHLRQEQRRLAHDARVHAALTRVLPLPLLDSIQKRSDDADRHATSYWRRDLLPQLGALGRVNCAAAIK